MFNLKYHDFLVCIAGLPHGQEKSGKTKIKETKVRIFFFKFQILSVELNQIPYI